ncbi:MAG TPA: hypothetical protein DD723_03250 [Candidatus Omnitrophica bacterium]|nr:MAG: hypothetical protein A2Z81_01025 [Omnitrophica WOR_2 bacterium GWA2_45_18]OGX19271.1 MAG: hypothetical protein A2Y04_00305 [Omnitrophica WOR_2 bacterium GWC2_45_7]HBR14546.1 hypothetical protein [Candidatus Omnitrophota bacterium]
MKFFTAKSQATQGHPGTANLVGNTRKREGGFDSFKLCNRVLAVLCGGMFVYIVVQIVSTPVESPGADPRKKKEEERIVKEFFLPSRQFFDFYQNEMSGRDIFKSLWEEEPKGESVPQPQPILQPAFPIDTNPVPLLQGQLKVVGIVLGDVPEAIVEDLQTHETVFLKRGERLGEALVDEILKDKVIFVYNNQRVELAP